MIACGATAQSSDVTYAYDLLGRLESATYSNGSTISYAYDAAGNRTSVVTTMGNQAPTAVDDAYNQQPSTNVLRNVLVNDTDPEGDTLSIASETGTFASISGAQIMVNTPAASGVYTFDYVASDGTANSAPATVTITVPNVAPNAVNDTGSQLAGSISNYNVLVNDSDVNGDSLTLTNMSDPQASIVSNQLRFNATSGAGTYPVTYTVSDGNGGTDTAVATITVTATNAPPNAANDSYTQTHGTTVDRNVIGNDTDPNGDSLTLTSENQSYSSIVNNKLRVVAPNASGAYVITYGISDGNGGSDTATATINVPNVAPNAVNNTYTQTHGTTVNHNVLGNDSDPNGDSLTLTGENRSYSSISSNQLRVVAPIASGAYVITYTISDGKGGTDTATATVNVPNVAPNAVNNTYTQTHGTAVNHNVLSNDSDPNGDSLTLTGENRSYSSISGNQLRVVAPNASGAYVITYTISDGKGGTDTATATVNVPNVAPNAVNNSYTQTAGTTVDHNVLGNDSDPNGDSLTLTNENRSYSSIVNNKLRVVAPSTAGAHVITYTVSDGKGGTDTATATINVPAQNSPPVANGESLFVPEGTTQQLYVLLNDTDPDGDPLTITSTTEGTVWAGGQSILYTAPNIGGFYNLTYTISDGNGGTDSANVILYVTWGGGGF